MEPVPREEILSYARYLTLRWVASNPNCVDVQSGYDINAATRSSSDKFGAWPYLGSLRVACAFECSRPDKEAKTNDFSMFR